MTDALKTFLIVGTYDSDKQRYAEYVDAANAEEAEAVIDEEMAHEGTPVAIAAVFEIATDLEHYVELPEDFEALKLVR